MHDMRNHLGKFFFMAVFYFELNYWISMALIKGECNLIIFEDQHLMESELAFILAVLPKSSRSSSLFLLTTRYRAATRTSVLSIDFTWEHPKFYLWPLMRKAKLHSEPTWLWDWCELLLLSKHHEWKYFTKKESLYEVSF